MNHYISTSHRLHVTGILWCGSRADHDYPISGKPPQALAEAKRIAGDFSELESAKVVTVHREITESKSTRRLKI